MASYRGVPAFQKQPRIVPALGALAISLAGGVLLLPKSPVDSAMAKGGPARPHISLLADIGPHAPMGFVPRGTGSRQAAGFAPQTAAFVPPTPPTRPHELQTARAAAPEDSAPEAELADASTTPLPPRRPPELAVAVNRDAPQEPEIAENRAEPPQPLPAPPRQVARLERTTIAPAAPPENRGFFERLFGGAPQAAAPSASRRAPERLAYAATQDSGGLFGGLHSPVAPYNPAARYDRYTAVYDISAHTVYLPDGRRLEAHSGLREHLDDPRYVHLRMRGATPPNVYELTPRERLFHGVAALRLNPIAGHTFGRAGLLAHTYMLGPNGDSNGCVSFRDYNAFLQAYRNGEVRRLAVVSRL